MSPLLNNHTASHGSISSPYRWSHVFSARARRRFGAVGCSGVERPLVRLWRVGCDGPSALAPFDLLTYFLFPCDTSQLLCGATSVAEHLTPEYPSISRLNYSSFIDVLLPCS